MAKPVQSYANHRKLVPVFHYVGMPMVAAGLVYFAARAFREPTTEHVMFLVFMMGLFIVAAFGRLFALGVQDRVIRLEERLRLERVLPDPLRSRIPELTTSHLVGLRFAGDDEVAGLMQRVLDGELTSRDEIKKAVRNWRADHQRV